MPIKVWIRIAVIRLSRVALLRLLFRSYYRGAWLVFSGLSRFLFPEIMAVKAHRGFASGEWEPGTSDIDVVLELAELGPEETACFSKEWRGFYRLFRLVFPVMGEPIFTTAREREFYRAWGDIRSFQERPPTAASSETVEAKTALDLWTECLHAHTRLCKIAVSKDPMPGPLAARELRKSVLDIARHSTAGLLRHPPRTARSRGATEADLKNLKDFPAQELLEILRRAAYAGSDDREIKRLAQLACAHAVNVLEHDAMSFFHRFNGLTGPAPDTTRFEASPSEAEQALHKLDLFKKRFGDFFHSAVLDNVFSSVMVFKDLPGPVGDLTCGISILDCLAEWATGMRGPVFVMGPGSCQLMGLGAYEDDPLKMGFSQTIELGADSAVCLQSGNREPFSGHRRSFLGARPGSNLAPRPPLLDALYRESLSHFQRTWRGLLPPGPGGPVYAVSRAVSLWLYFVEGISRPCFPLQPLLQTFRRQRALEGADAVFEASLTRGLQPSGIELLAALNAQTLAAAEESSEARQVQN